MESLPAAASQPDLPEARGAIGGIIAVSAAASGFLFWLLYFRHAPPQFATSLTFLPALNALFNGLSATALCCGLYFIKNKRAVAHQRSMVTAFVFSSLFLVSYIVHHTLHGDVKFGGAGGMKIFPIWLYVSVTGVLVYVMLVAYAKVG